MQIDDARRALEFRGYSIAFVMVYNDDEGLVRCDCAVHLHCRYKKQPLRRAREYRATIKRIHIINCSLVDDSSATTARTTRHAFCVSNIPSSSIRCIDENGLVYCVSPRRDNNRVI